jgi:hypothetical protein
MATPKFIEVPNTGGSWLNDSDEFVLVLGTFNASSALGDANMYVASPSGKNYFFDTAVPNVGTDATAYPYATIWGVEFTRAFLIPPGWSAVNTGGFYGLQGSLEDLRGYM